MATIWMSVRIMIYRNDVMRLDAPVARWLLCRTGKTASCETVRCHRIYRV